MLHAWEWIKGTGDGKQARNAMEFVGPNGLSLKISDLYIYPVSGESSMQRNINWYINQGFIAGKNTKRVRWQTSR